MHFIKKNMWFLETALAMLEGDDVTEAEKEKAREHVKQAHERRKIGIVSPYVVSARGRARICQDLRSLGPRCPRPWIVPAQNYR